MDGIGKKLSKGGVHRLSLVSNPPGLHTNSSPPSHPAHSWIRSSWPARPPTPTLDPRSRSGLTSLSPAHHLTASCTSLLLPLPPTLPTPIDPPGGAAPRRGRILVLPGGDGRWRVLCGFYAGVARAGVARREGEGREGAMGRGGHPDPPLVKMGGVKNTGLGLLSSPVDA